MQKKNKSKEVYSKSSTALSGVFLDEDIKGKVDSVSQFSDEVQQEMLKEFSKMQGDIGKIKQQLDWDSEKGSSNILDKISANMKDLTAENDELKADIYKSNKQIEKTKTQWVTFIGLFVSIFTFISIEIQILRYVCDFWRIAGFSLIIFSCLSGFVILLDYFSQKWVATKEDRKIVFPEEYFSRYFWNLLLLGVFIASIPYLFLWAGFDGFIKNTCIVSSESFSNIEHRLDLLENNNKIIPNR
ncbi:MAG: hypothetical protein WAV73_04230 [Candidatus Moraniibacteriota bacterium]